jgi:NAD+ kinase
MASLQAPPQKLAAIISRPARPEVAKVLPELLKWLTGHGYDVVIDEETGKYGSGPEVVPRSEIAFRSA